MHTERVSAAPASAGRRGGAPILARSPRGRVEASVADDLRGDVLGESLAVGAGALPVLAGVEAAECGLRSAGEHGVDARPIGFG